jgi:serine/threonine protein kinase
MARLWEIAESRYELVSSLGEGGYGRAFLVKSREAGDLFVIKEVPLASLKPKERDDALREADVLASVSHPNIVRYVESFQEHGCFYIVMEYADGGDLAKKLESRNGAPLPESEVLHDFIQLAIAIKYIHDRKILHRDLKAENVFLMKDGTVKLGDFGIAKVLEHTFQLCQTQVGTPYYLSPEICDGANYNSKTDIWSLGCILYQLCTLKYPFDASNLSALLMAIMRGKYQPVPTTYSKDLRNLLGRMLTKKPEKRPSANQILGLPFIKKRLSSLLDETLESPRLSSPKRRAKKPATPAPGKTKKKGGQKRRPETKAGSARPEPDFPDDWITDEEPQAAPPSQQPERLCGGLASSFRDALQLPSAEDDDDDDIGFELQEQPAVFFIGEKEVRFPIGNDAQGKRARAAAMRDFLVREIGADVLARVLAELRDHELRYDAESPTCESLDPGFVIIARQLYVVEFEE